MKHKGLFKAETIDKPRWACIGNLVEERETGRYFIVDLSHFDNETKLDDVMIEIVPETIEKVEDE